MLVNVLHQGNPIDLGHLNVGDHEIKWWVGFGKQCNRLSTAGRRRHL